MPLVSHRPVGRAGLAAGPPALALARGDSGVDGAEGLLRMCGGTYRPPIVYSQSVVEEV